MAAKIAFFANEAISFNYSSLSDESRPPENESISHCHIWRAASGQKMVKIKKFKMAVQTGSETKVVTSSLILVHLTS